MLIKKSVLTIGLIAVFSFSAVHAQTLPKYREISKQLVIEAKLALTSSKPETALLLFERAIVADPANTQALLGLGRTHELEGRVGRGLKYYRQALEIEPNDKFALRDQALAFLKQDLMDRADGNRAKLARLCPNGCEALERVEVALKAHIAEVDRKDIKTAGAPNG